MQFQNTMNIYEHQQFASMGQQHIPMVGMVAPQQQFMYTPLDLSQMQTLIQLPLQIPVPNSIPSMAPLPFQQEHLMFPMSDFLQKPAQNFSDFTPCYVDPQTGLLTPCRSRSASFDLPTEASPVLHAAVPCEDQVQELGKMIQDTNFHSTSDVEQSLKLESGPQKKYAYRSKQRKIDKVRSQIEEKYQCLELFAGEKELVRGEDTVRVHVKTFLGLTKITEFLDEVENHNEIRITRIACPFSKKNKNQKKGFIVYLKVQTVTQMMIVRDEIFPKYEPVLKSCVVAKPREPLVEKPEGKDTLFADLQPTAMVKVGSFSG